MVRTSWSSETLQDTTTERPVFSAVHRRTAHSLSDSIRLLTCQEAGAPRRCAKFTPRPEPRRREVDGRLSKRVGMAASRFARESESSPSHTKVCRAPANQASSALYVRASRLLAEEEQLHVYAAAVKLECAGNATDE